MLGYANGNSVSVTFSNNYFDGTATYSTGCDGYHYWGFMFMGVQGRITLYVDMLCVRYYLTHPP